MDPTAADVCPWAISDYEKAHYYNGISGDPPELLYRSDLLTNPYPVPKGRFFSVPVKSVRGAFGTRLKEVWDDVGPLIIGILKARAIRYSALMAVRFHTTHGEEDVNGSFGPVVIWIATHPGTTTAENAYDASPEILALLATYEVEGAVVEWYEGSLKRL